LQLKQGKMEIKIIQETKNPLFNRKEVAFEIKSDFAPNKADIEKIISEKFSAKPEAFKIKKISSNFGSKNFKVIANIYSSRKEKEGVEFKSKKEKEAEKKEIEGEIAKEKTKKKQPAEEPENKEQEK